MPLRLPFHYLAQSVAPSGWQTKLLALLSGFFWGYVAGGSAERTAIQALLVLIVCDLVTGIAASFRKGRKLSSRRMADSAYKFLGYACVIIAAAAIQKIMPDGFTSGAVVGFTTFFCGTEVLSLAENVRHLGIKDHGMIKRVADALISETGEHEPRGPKVVRKGP